MNPDGGVAGWTDAEMEDGFIPAEEEPKEARRTLDMRRRMEFAGTEQIQWIPAAGLQSVMTRTATPRAPSGSMTDVFACARAQIYYNIKRKPLAQVKRETGCSHIINGYLFNGRVLPGLDGDRRQGHQSGRLSGLGNFHRF